MVGQAAPGEAPPDESREETTQTQPEERREDVSAQAAESQPMSEEAEGVGEAGHPEQSDAEPARYTVDDLAAATGLSAEAVLEAVQIAVEADGKSEQKSLAEVLKGYKWNAANTQKEQAMAEQRKALEVAGKQAEEMHAAALSVFQAQINKVSQAEQALEQQVQGVDWAALQAKGDGSYADAQAWLNAQRQALGQQREAATQAQTVMLQQRQKARQEFLQQQGPVLESQLLERVPEWRDGDLRKSESERLAAYIRSSGANDSELESITYSPLAIDLSRKAMLYDEGRVAETTARAKVDAKVSTLPPITLRPGQAGGRARASQQERAQEVRRAVSGGVRDLAKLIERDMGRR